MLPFELTTGQKNALSMIETGKHTLICGQPGVGKSAILEILKEFYGDTIIFGGLTGAANAGLFNHKGGVGTAHKIWSLPLGIATSKDWKDVNKYTNTIFAGSDKVLRVVLDEGFMLNSEQLALINHRIKRFNKKTKKRKQRSIQLIVVGDPAQIQSVLKSDQIEIYKEKYGHELFFLSDIYKDMNFQVCMLTEVMRQKDPVFKAAMQVIRNGEKHRYHKLLQWLNRRVIPAPESAVVIAPTNKQVDYYNKLAFDRNPNECFCYTAEIEGDFNMDNCPVPMELDLKEGLSVVGITNDIEGRWVNGTAMTVGQCTSEGVYCKIVRTGEEVFVPLFTFEEHELFVEGQEFNHEGVLVDTLGTRVKGSCTTVGLKPAASLSGHRCQGMTADYPILIDMGSEWPFLNTDFGVNLLQVMLTRVTKLEYLYLKRPLTPAFIKVCEETLQWLSEVENNG
jgi:hypothetical protein